MKQSLRAKRMAKHHRRLKTVPKLNLVSLMDIFTILVFFLLVNSSDVEVLQADKSIKLPASVSDIVPENNLVIMVNAEAIIVAGQHVLNVADAMDDDANTLAALKTELNYQSKKARPLSEQEKLVGRPVTIMGDHTIPYALLKKIMATCAAADYRDISLAVAQKTVGKNSGAATGGEG